MFNQSILSEIRDRTPIVAFINERLPLKKAGRNYKGLCPFHQEKTPSFMVSDEKQIFHCFGCGEGGDVFKFLMKYEGLSFTEAVSLLADRVGVALPKIDIVKDQDEGIFKKKKWYFRINQIALEHFQERFRAAVGQKARNYLKLREIKDETSKQLFLGYAEKGWDNLVRYFREKKVPLKLASELGLIKEKNDGYYDFFRDRLMFPIVSVRGEVVGFSGRTLDEESDTAKYLNSPDSLIYHKSNFVFGLNIAADSIRKNDQVLIVEGNIDLVSLYQAGIRNVVAPLGTALTSGHLRLLSRYTKNMIVIFDGDEAGATAATRSLPLFIEAHLTPKAIALPKGDDPDSFIRKNGAEKFLELVENAKTLFEHVVDLIAERSSSDTKGRIDALQNIIPLLSEIKNPVEVGLYKGYAAGRFKVKEELITEALTKKDVKASQKGQFGVKKIFEKSDRSNGWRSSVAERLLLETMIAKPYLIENVASKVRIDHFMDFSCRTICEIMLDEYAQQKNVNLTNLLEKIVDPELAASLRQLAMEENTLSDQEAIEVLKDCVEAIEKRSVTEKIETINNAIREAELEGNEGLLFELLAKKRDITALNIK